MQYGYFDNQARHATIVEQLSWLYRVRGNHHQQRWGIITNNAGGYGFYQ
jgi:hypothetical protein